MKKLNQIILLTFLGMFMVVAYNSALYAAKKSKNQALKQNHKGEIVEVRVNGMVCDFCAQSLNKTLGKKDSVESINVNLSKQLVTVYLKLSQTLSDKEIAKLIKSNGFNLVSIKRSKAKS